jgi:hypothetical protein
MPRASYPAWVGIILSELDNIFHPDHPTCRTLDERKKRVIEVIHFAAKKRSGSNRKKPSPPAKLLDPGKANVKMDVVAADVNGVQMFIDDVGHIFYTEDIHKGLLKPRIRYHYTRDPDTGIITPIPVPPCVDESTADSVPPSVLDAVVSMKRTRKRKEV